MPDATVTKLVSNFTRCSQDSLGLGSTRQAPGILAILALLRQGHGDSSCPKHSPKRTCINDIRTSTTSAERQRCLPESKALAANFAHETANLCLGVTSPCDTGAQDF